MTTAPASPGLTGATRVTPDAFIVSLAGSHRRRRSASAQLGHLGIPHVFCDAIDGDDARSVYAAFDCGDMTLPRLYLHRDKPISPRELACSLSHFRAIRAAIEAGRRAAWILEDDVDFLCRDASVFSRVLAAAPEDAAYIQFQVVPPDTIDALHDRFMATGALYQRKRRLNPFQFSDPALAAFTCHGAVAYFLTEFGMRNIASRFLPDGRVRFPCAMAEVATNMGLVADKLVYWGATDEQHHGYVVSVPLVSTDAIDSYLHTDHLPEHRVARERAIAIYQRQTGVNGPSSDPVSPRLP